MASAAGGSARADDRLGNPNLGAAAGFRICENQTYALCAVASCFVFNEVAYCKCDVKMGNSISLPFKFDDGKDVCTVNADGAANGYMVSTFSLGLPGSVRRRSRKQGSNQRRGRCS